VETQWCQLLPRAGTTFAPKLASTEDDDDDDDDGDEEEDEGLEVVLVAAEVVVVVVEFMKAVLSSFPFSSLLPAPQSFSSAQLLEEPPITVS